MTFRFSFDPTKRPRFGGRFIKAYPNLPGWDRLTAVSTYGPPGSEEDDELDSGWDFSGLGNPSAMRDFMTACDYCLSGCSDDGQRKMTSSTLVGISPGSVTPVPCETS